MLYLTPARDIPEHKPWIADSVYSNCRVVLIGHRKERKKFVWLTVVPPITVNDDEKGAGFAKLPESEP